MQLRGEASQCRQTAADAVAELQQLRERLSSESDTVREAVEVISVLKRKNADAVAEVESLRGAVDTANARIDAQQQHIDTLQATAGTDEARIAAATGSSIARRGVVRL